MLRVSLCVSVVLLGVIYALPAGPVCHINDVVQSGGEKRVSVVCGSDEVVELHMSDQDHLSEFSASVVRKGERGVKLLAVEYHTVEQDMFVEVEGTKYSVKDESTKAEESEKLRALYNNPQFRYFPVAVKLIHDELELKGWESPAVMFLYRMAMAMEAVQPTVMKRNAPAVDALTYLYHGPSPKKRCYYNGWSTDDMPWLVNNECIGVCGGMCSDCWIWLCGDCCMHTGCKRHDEFCGGPKGLYDSDCVSGRGVLWDTTTNFPLDC